MKIAVTVDNRNSLFVNGINQNAWFLIKLLKNLGHDTTAITADKKYLSDIDDHAILNLLKDTNVIELKNAFKLKYDIIIMLGFLIPNESFKLFLKKSPHIKIVYYKCGNEMITDMESMLFLKKLHHSNIYYDYPTPHQIWSIPQMESTNIEYYKLKYNQENATVVPFIWDPSLIEFFLNKKQKKEYNGKLINRIGTMEPNISVMKNIFVPVNIIAKVSKHNLNINNYILYSSEHLSKNETLLSIINRHGLHKKIKILLDSRKHIVDILGDEIDLVLSWQWENNLNYLPLDVIWLGYPMLHNMEMLKDIGYYYDRFNISQAVSEINNITNNHPSDLNYLNLNREKIKRYTIYNDRINLDYNNLLTNLVNNKFTKYSYDWKTNSIH